MKAWNELAIYIINYVHTFTVLGIKLTHFKLRNIN